MKKNISNTEAMEAEPGERYSFLRYTMPYSAAYNDGEYKEQEELDKLLESFVFEKKPRFYRIVNAQVLFIPAGSGNSIGGSAAVVQHIIHVAYVL